MLRSLRPFIIKRSSDYSFKLYSNLVGEIKHKSLTDSASRECVNYDYKLCELRLDEISHKIDMIEILPYEKFFHSEEQVMVPITSQLRDESISVNQKYYDILDGFNLLKSEISLPRKIQEVINILKLKMLPIFPEYEPKSNNLIICRKASYDFISNVISNTNKNAAYIDVCIQKGDFEKAFNLMKQIRIENINITSVMKRSLIVDSIFYEPSINVLGKKGKLEIILQFLNEMDTFNILPRISIIFRSLEAASKNDRIDPELINRLMNYIKKHSLSLEDAFIRAPISKDNFFHIIRAVKVVYPEFEIVCKSPKFFNKSALKATGIHSTIEELEKCFDAQLLNEQLTSVSLDPIYKFKVDKSIITKLKFIEDKWRVDLGETFEKKIALLIYSDRYKLYPYLSVLPVRSYVDAMIQVVYQLSTDNGLQFSNIKNVYYLIGDIIHNMYRHRCLKKQKYFNQLKAVCLSYFDKLSDESQHKALDQLWRQSILENIEGGSIGSNVIEWDRSIRSDIGRFLYEIMFENLNFTFQSNDRSITTPVIYEQVEEDSNGVFISVKVQSRLKTLLKSVDKALPNFSQLEMPMVHPPIPFSNNYNTSFFYLTNYATRMIRKASFLELYDEDLNQPHDLSNIYNALNTLSLCAWRVDNENLDLITNIFNNEGDMNLKIPLFSSQIIKPPNPESTAGFKEKIDYRQKHAQYVQTKREMYSLWATVFYRISIAKKFKNRKIWFPYSMDFRSRVYPCSPHLNHIGDDVCRGLLKFSLGKKLGPKGLDWIKIHLVNLCGTHKRSSNVERLAVANDAMENIIDSAKNPLDGKGWWQTSEKPWQTLLVCREIYNATKYAIERGNGLADDFVSNLPIHQDGSCNGLQHYAALGKDIEGARVVNLIDSDVPQDVYSDVLKHVEKKRKLDAEQGVKEAIELEGLLSRKVIKQSVMTTVYGVTLFGAKDQIHRQLKELNKLSNEALFRCSLYLSKITLNSIGEIFSSASKIQNWFVQLAGQISNLRKSNISWKTPLNLLVTQPYFSSTSDLMKPSVIKNRNAFPPNFIHSLDSSHMMMTALRCWAENITFVSVHDCFWTHACDVDAMNKICREEFVKLHSMPILDDLSKYLVDKYQFDTAKSLTKAQSAFNKVLVKIPEQGTFNIQEVLNSTYFFS